MAEVGLVPFAQLALQVAARGLPRYRTRFSKHQFTQPQLLAMVCLMRYADWTLREAEVRVNEHGELRRALRLRSVPDYTTLHRFLRRVPEPTFAALLAETVRRFPRREPARVAVDATGVPHRATSTYYHQVIHPRPRWQRPWYWVKWLVAVDVDRQLLLAQQVRAGPVNDCGHLPTLLEQAAQTTSIGLVLADAEFDSERNHRFIRGQLRARSVIPAKKGHRSWRIHGIRAQMRRRFPQRVYGRRALIETVFAAVKRKLSARAPGRSLFMQRRQALVLGLAYNLYRV
jgi:hypothetical protein